MANLTGPIEIVHFDVSTSFSMSREDENDCMFMV